MNETVRVLVVDDEKAAVRNLRHVLTKEGYHVTTAASGQAALRLLREERFHVVLTDLRMERVDGMQLLERCKRIAPETEVIMITGYATVDTAVDAMRKGAYHYIAKPFKLDEVRGVVRGAAEKSLLRRENRRLRERLEQIEHTGGIVTNDPEMLHLLEMARQIAPTDCNTLITGESGTGKELLARYIHHHSNRAGGPFLAVNCGAFTDELLGNELFGHEQGAFTGATLRKHGLLETASRGTLFLDEVSEMSPAMQVRLLRVIQSREFQRIGGTKSIRVDVRFIAATNRDLKELIESGEFRHDLFYRLNVVTMVLPPLARRRGDIPLLAHHFLRKYAELMGKETREIAPDVLELFQQYDFPGNVRELENLIERGVALSRGPILEIGGLPDDLQGFKLKTFRVRQGEYPSLADQEKAYIQWVLERVEGNKTRAARILGIDRVSLWRKLKRFGMEQETD